MKRNALFNIASSSAIIAVTMVGCSGAALNNRAGASAGKLEKMAVSQARGAEQALARRDSGLAIQIAEAAVAADPHNAEYRTLLGRAYLMGGRFDSARASFADALALGSADARTIVNLSLIHVAQGRNDQAQELLASNITHLSAADYGLAMAMAGNPEEAIRILSEAIHAPNATAKERQNLAYSYALAGRWVEARQMASMDLAPLDAARRVMGWAQMAQPGAESQRVIAMMGVSPRGDDAGLPVRLALSQPAASSPVQLAETHARPEITTPIISDVQAPAEIAYGASDTAPPVTAPADIPATPAEPQRPAPSSMPVEMAGSETVKIPEFVPARRASAPAVASGSGAPLSPMLRPAATPLMKTDVPAARSAPIMKEDIPAPRRAAIWRPVDATRGSNWVVQLGAFSSAERAKAGWTTYVRGNEKLGLFPLVRSEVNIGGRQLHRVAIAGFGDRSAAVSMCARIRVQGGDCFVRQGGTEAAPSRWTTAERSRFLAMR